MNRRLSVPLPFALLLAGLAPLGVWLAPQDKPKEGGPQAGAKMAVVNLQPVFDNDASLKVNITAINARGEKLQADLSKMRDDYNELRLQRDKFPDKFSENYLRANSLVSAKEAEMKQFAASCEDYLKREEMLANLEAYQRYRVAIGQIAAARGLDVVLRFTDPDAKDRSLGSRMQAAELGMVLYRDPKLDITDDVIQLLKTQK